MACTRPAAGRRVGVGRFRQGGRGVVRGPGAGVPNRVGGFLADLAAGPSARVPALARSHSIVYIDALLSAALILTSRLSFRSLETIGQWLRVKGDRVLIYGAGDAGELILRELVNNDELNLQPTCFIDDDQRKHGANIHGVPVVGGRESLALAVQRYRVRKIVLGTRKLAPDAVAAIRSFAAHHELDVAEFDFGLKLVPQRAMEQDTIRSPSTDSRSAV